MKILLIAIFLYGCAHQKPMRPAEDLVSVQTALDAAQSSYLKGCVDGMKELKVPLAFHGCRDKSLLHRQELEYIMSRPIE